MKKYLKLFLFIAIGIIGGLVYYNFWGCDTGCAIKSNPYTMSFYGAAIGLILGFPTKRKKN